MMKKKWIPIFALLVWVMVLPSSTEASSGQKIGILFSDVINDYSLSTNPGKTNAMTLPFATKPVDVAAKVKYSPINDKALKCITSTRRKAFPLQK